MLFTLIAQDYFLWHYTRAFGEFFRVWLNLLWFTINFFSLPQLFRSLFAPFKRMTEERQRGDTVEDIFGTFIINILSRIMGAIMRTVIIGIGLVCLTIVIVIGAVTYILWVVLPIVALLSLVAGVSFLII